MLAVRIYWHGINHGWALVAATVVVVFGTPALIYLERKMYTLSLICVLLAAISASVPAYFLYQHSQNQNRRQAIWSDFRRQGLSIHASDSSGIVLNTLPHCVRVNVVARKPGLIWRAIPRNKNLRQATLAGYVTRKDIVRYAKKIC